MLENHKFGAEEKSCENCRHFSKFTEPREFENGVVVHGICYIKAQYDGYPVYVPGAFCRAHKAKKESGGR